MLGVLLVLWRIGLVDGCDVHSECATDMYCDAGFNCYTCSYLENTCDSFDGNCCTTAILTNCPSDPAGCAGTGGGSTTSGSGTTTGYSGGTTGPGSSGPSGSSGYYSGSGYSYEVPPESPPPPPPPPIGIITPTAEPCIDSSARRTGSWSMSTAPYGGTDTLTCADAVCDWGYEADDMSSLDACCSCGGGTNITGQGVATDTFPAPWSTSAYFVDAGSKLYIFDPLEPTVVKSMEHGTSNIVSEAVTGPVNVLFKAGIIFDGRNTIYLAGGANWTNATWDDRGIQDLVYSLNIDSLVWSQHASLPLPMLDLTMLYFEGVVYTFGGYSRAEYYLNYRPGKVFDMFNVTEGTWVTIPGADFAQAPVTLSGSTGTIMSDGMAIFHGSLLVTYGTIGSDSVSSTDFWTFNFRTQAWQQFLPPRFARNELPSVVFPQLVVSGEYLYLFGGYEFYCGDCSGMNACCYYSLSKLDRSYSAPIHFTRPVTARGYRILFTSAIPEWEQYNVALPNSGLIYDAFFSRPTTATYMSGGQLFAVYAGRAEVTTFPLVCPTGSYLDAGACRVASPGFFANTTDMSEQIACPPGFVSEDYGASQCRRCPPGEISNSDNTACTECGSGTFSSGGTSTCTPCTPGSFSLISGSNKCNPCGPGTYAPNSASTECIDSNAGFIVKGSAASTQEPCPAGTYSSSGDSECEACDEGYVAAPQQPACTACSAGFVARVSECVPCAKGLTSNAQSETCTLCPPGQYAPTEGSPECLVCPAGFYSPAGSSECIGCAPGFVARRANSGECVPCEPGSYSPTSNSSTCINCIPTEFQPNEGKSSCLPCGTNAYNTDGRTRCECQSGKYGGRPECFDCPIGGVCDDAKVLPDTAQGFARMCPKNAEFYECQPAEACLGDKLGNFEDPCAISPEEVPLCNYPYHGKVCSQCLDGFNKVFDSCWACRTNVEASGAFWFLFLVALAYTLVSFLFPMFLEGAARDELVFRLKRTVPSILSSLEFLQMLGTLGRFRFTWPETFLAAFRNFDVANFTADSVACISYLDAWRWHMSVAPLIIACLLLCGAVSWLVLKMLQKQRDGFHNIFHHFAHSALLLLDLMYLGLCVRTFEGLNCRGSKDDYYLVAYPDIDCESDYYKNNILDGSISGLFFFVVLIPVLHIALFVLYNRGNSSPEMRAKDRWPETAKTAGAAPTTEASQFNPMSDKCSGIRLVLAPFVPLYFRDRHAAFVRHQVIFLFLKRLGVALALIPEQPIWNAITALLAVYLFSVIPLVYFYPYSSKAANTAGLLQRAVELFLLVLGLLFSFRPGDQVDIGVQPETLATMGWIAIAGGLLLGAVSIVYDMLRPLHNPARKELLMVSDRWYPMDDKLGFLNDIEVSKLQDTFSLMNMYMLDDFEESSNSSAFINESTS